MRWCLIVLCSISYVFSSDASQKDVRIISFPSKAGFVKDVVILDEALESLGCLTDKQYLPEMLGHVIENDACYPVVDVQIFIQEFEERLLPFGKKNYLIPNPEWCWETAEGLKRVDLILARTREVERIYTDAELPVYFLGFTGVDHYVEGMIKNFSQYFHLKGFSPHKSAHEIVEAWLPDFPLLILIDHWPNYKKVVKRISIISDYLTDDEIKGLQNYAGVHLCPSQTEGFGHYLAEAMSVGSVVITTDAPPMNEFIKDKRFLIKPGEVTSKHGWATLYHLSPSEIRKTINAVRQIPSEELNKIGQANRKKFLEMQNDFLQRLEQLIRL